ncbi:MAG: TIGR02117 family protein [Croceibacterium sp.]
MAASPLRRLIRWVGWAALGLFGLIVAYSLAGWIGSSIPRNAGWREPAANDPGAVTIMVETNGVHTALVLPLVTPERDWRPIFPDSEIAAPSPEYTHVAVSWGEKQVFLYTPTWGNLRPWTVLRIVGIGGDGVLHVAHYIRPTPADDIRRLRITHEQYARLVAAIDRSLPKHPRVRYRGYGQQDVFYDAPGHYTVETTCNQWTSNTLAAAGVKTGAWTPFAGGVMKWVPPVGS